MAKSQFRKGCNQQSKHGLIRTTVFKLGAGLKIALHQIIVSKSTKVEKENVSDKKQ